MSANADALAALYREWLRVIAKPRSSYASSDECAAAFGRWADVLGVRAPDLKADAA